MASSEEQKEIKSDAASMDRKVGVGPALVDSIAAVLERGKSLQDTATKYSGRLKSEGDALGEEAISLEKEIKKFLKDVNKAAEGDDISQDLTEDLEEKLYRARGMVYEGDVAALLPHKANGEIYDCPLKEITTEKGMPNTSGWLPWDLSAGVLAFVSGLFLGLFLGHVNVRSARRDVRFKVKEEYNSYRDRTAVLFLTFPLLLLLLKYQMWEGCFPGVPVHAYQACLLFFYTSLALRENILRINGSDIRPWWIQHHYYAMFMALVSLTWGIEGPDCEQKQRVVSLFLAWAVMQGVAMLLQNHYQRQRLYTRIALGKAGKMDVVWGETAGVKGQLWLLYPLLFVLQAFQFHIGLQLLIVAIYERFEWQVATCGMLLIIMALGNFGNTIGTLITKNRIKAKMRKQGSKMLEHMGSKSFKSS